MIRLLEDCRESEAAFGLLKDRFMSAPSMNVSVAIPAYELESTIDAVWYPNHKFWVSFDLPPRLILGLADCLPGPEETVAVTLDLVIPHQGFDRLAQGAFAGDDYGNLLLIHKGGLGANNKRDGRKPFLQRYGGIVLEVRDGDREATVAVIAGLGSTRFLEQVVSFLKEVERLKEDLPEAIDEALAFDPTLIPFQYRNRKGKTFYLQKAKTRKGASICIFSTEIKGEPLCKLPEGCEPHECPSGQVCLRKIKAKLIEDFEVATVERHIPESPGRFMCRVTGKRITILEADHDMKKLEASFRSSALARIDFVKYVRRRSSFSPVCRFTLRDSEKRLFLAERCDFKGSDEWINVGRPGKLEKLAKKCLKHLGQESFYRL